VLTAAVVCLLLVATWGGVTYGWASPTIILLSIASAALFTVFVFVERRAEEPVLPLHLFKSKIFTVSNVASLVIGAAMFGTIIYIPVFVQRVINGSATNAGVVLIPLMLAVVGAVVLSGQIVTRTGRYKVFPILGSTLSLGGFWLLSRLTVDATSGQAIIGMILLGVGIGLMMQTYTLAVQNDAKREEMGTATATTQFSRSIGGTIGVAAYGAILAQRLANEMTTLGSDGSLNAADRHLAWAHALHTVFLATLPLAVLALVLAFLLKEKPLRTEAFVQSHAAEVGEGATVIPIGAKAAQDIADTADGVAANGNGAARDEEGTGEPVSTHLL